MTENFSIRPALSKDLPRALELLPQLADFPLPDNRDALDLWQSDAQLLEKLLDGQLSDRFCDVAANAKDELCALALVTLREELMSHQPSAHLEALVVAPEARGTGLGRRLITHAEQHAASLGAQSITLHVFANNRRARNLYDTNGYDSELIRAIKWFD